MHSRQDSETTNVPEYRSLDGNLFFFDYYLRHVYLPREDFHRVPRRFARDTILGIGNPRESSVYVAGGMKSPLNHRPTLRATSLGKFRSLNNLRHHVASAGYSNPHLGPPQPS